MNIAVKAFLTAEGFDRMVAESAPIQAPKLPKILWGAATIAHKIGVSADFVRDRLVHEPGSPVKKVCGKYCAVEDELFSFFRV